MFRILADVPVGATTRLRFSYHESARRFLKAFILSEIPLRELYQESDGTIVVGIDELDAASQRAWLEEILQGACDESAPLSKPSELKDDQDDGTERCP